MNPNPALPYIQQLAATSEQPKTEDVKAALRDFSQLVESGSGHGKNEEGDEFIEIKEDESNMTVRDDEGEDDEAGGAAALVPVEIEESVEQEDEQDEEDDEEDDDDEFEAMMQEMEMIELLPPPPPSPRLPPPPPATGLKKGFLLPSSSSSSQDVSESSTVNKPVSILKKQTQPEIQLETETQVQPFLKKKAASSAFTGAVVERDAGSSSFASIPPLLPGFGSVRDGKEEEEVAPKRVSRFKQKTLY